jgi:hypothetical protein
MEDPAMNRWAILWVVFISLIVLPCCCAGQVTILAGQKEYFFLTGEETALPLTLSNTGDHDITGVLRSIMITEKPGEDATRTVQEKTFTLFIGNRSYLMPAGRSDTPLVFQCDIVFLYPDNGGRRTTLEGIMVHFVKNPSEIRINQSTQASTDTPDPASGSGGSMSVSGSTHPSTDPFQKLQDNQIPQDPENLQQQIQKEDAGLRRQKSEFLSLLMQEITIREINQSLINGGFELTDHEVFPVTNRSGNFSFSYEQEGKTAIVSGSVDNGRFLNAYESSKSSLPLPALLAVNETFRQYERELARGGYLCNATLVHYRPERVTVDLTYSNGTDHVLHLTAAIVNGSIVSINRDGPDESLPFLVPVLLVVFICLLSGGILFLSRRLPRQVPEGDKTSTPGETRAGYLVAAETMLEEADLLAGKGLYHDAYAQAGRALRCILSHTMSDGRELTNEETSQLPALKDAGNVRVTRTLERCSRVAFAKDTPDPEEFKRILAFIREMLSSGEA